MIPILFLILVVICMVVAAAWIRDMHRFVVASYQITSTRIKKETKMVILSDLHNKSYGNKNEALRNEIAKQRPDFVLIAGDMFTANPSLDFSVSLELIKELSRTYKIYYANGNHEQKIKHLKEIYGTSFEEYKKELEAEKVVFLENKTVYLPEKNLDLIGLEIERKYFKRMKKVEMPVDAVTKLIGEPNAKHFKILLAHNPDYFETYAQWGADLTLSGHVHGGVMRLPALGGVISPSFHIFPKYDGGLYESKRKKMILGRGLGTHTIPIRIFNPGELVAVTLLPKQENEEGK